MCVPPLSTIDTRLTSARTRPIVFNNSWISLMGIEGNEVHCQSTCHVNSSFMNDSREHESVIAFHWVLIQVVYTLKNHTSLGRRIVQSSARASTLHNLLQTLLRISTRETLDWLDWESPWRCNSDRVNLRIITSKCSVISVPVSRKLRFPSLLSKFNCPQCWLTGESTSFPATMFMPLLDDTMLAFRQNAGSFVTFSPNVPCLRAKDNRHSSRLRSLLTEIPIYCPTS